MDNSFKLIMSGFMAILLGVVLIQVVADETERVKSSYTNVSNETVTLSHITTTVTNESVTVSDVTTTVTNETASVTQVSETNFSVTYNVLSSVTELRNFSSDIVTGECNSTLETGDFICNNTVSNGSVVYADYVYKSGLSGSTTYFDLSSSSAIRNFSATVVTHQCNVTLANGDLSCNRTASNGSVVYVDYVYRSGKSGTLANDEVIAIYELRNITSEIVTTSCNITTTSGALRCNNTLSTTMYASYRYTPDTYVRNSTSRTLLDTNIIFFAIAIMLFGVGMAYKGIKDWSG